MRFHPRILTPRQRAVLADLGPVAAARGFYLAGGTAIALLLGHRMSDDFDWFIERPFDPLQLAAEVRTDLPFATVTEAQDTLWGTVSGVKTSFIRFAYPLLEDRVGWPRFGIELASIEDLTTMKLSAIVQRGSRKDFIDLFAIGTWGAKLALDDMLDLYCQRFKTDAVNVLYGLSYFADADKERMPKMLRDLSWDEVKKTISTWVERRARH